MENQAVETEVQVPEVPPEEVQQTEETPQKPYRPNGITRRFGELADQRKAALERASQVEEENRMLRERLAQADPNAHVPAPQQDIQALAEKIADQKLQQRQLGDQLKSIDDAGRKSFGDDYDRAVDNLRMAGVGSPEFVHVLAHVPNPEKVVQYLGQGDNLDEAMRIASLPPAQMGIELMKLAPKAVKATAKPVSSAPAPITPISGGGGGSDGAEPDRKDTQAWMKWRNDNARRK